MSGRARLPGLRDLSGQRGFRRLIASQVTSQAADGLYQIAIAAVLIFGVDAAETPGQITKVLAVTLLPFSLVGPFTGPFIDRFSRRSILTGTSVARAALTFALIPATGWPEWIILSLVVANMSVNRFFHATKSSALPTLVPRHRYLLANTVSSVGGMVFGLAGAVVGGPVADAASAEMVILAAGVLMTVAAIVAATVPLPPGERKGLAGLLGELRDDARDVRDGLGLLLGTPRAVYAIASIWSIRGLIGFLLLAGIVLLRRRFGLETTGASLLLGAIGIGGFLGALLVTPAARRLGDVRVAPLAYLVAGVTVLALGAIPAWPALVTLVAVGGAAMAMTKITADTMVQRAIPDSYRGRAFAMYDIGYNGVFVLAALIPTLLIGLLGDIGIVFLAGTLAVIGAGMFALASRRLREIEVRAYAGGRADETPREVVIDGTRLTVAEVERSWHEERAGRRLLVFVLRMEDGRRLQLSRGEKWRIDRFLGEPG
ncbi:MAG TPA: MFS transporter [Actinomycetota bacterium]